VGAVDVAGALADPGQVGGQVVVALAPGHGLGLGGLVVQRQAFVAGEELHPGQVVDGLLAQRFHELQRLGQLADHAPVLLAQLGRQIGA
jgi:hypothetical protein